MVFKIAVGRIDYPAGEAAREPEFCKTVANRMQPELVILECEHTERLRIVRARQPDINGEIRTSDPTPSIMCVCYNNLGPACEFILINKPSDTIYFMEDVDGNPVINEPIAARDFHEEYEHRNMVQYWETNFVPTEEACLEATKRADADHVEGAYHCDEPEYTNMSIHLGVLGIELPGLPVVHCTCRNSHTGLQSSFFLRIRSRRSFYLLEEFCTAELGNSDDELTQQPNGHPNRYTNEYSNGHSNVYGDGEYLKLIGII